MSARSASHHSSLPCAHRHESAAAQGSRHIGPADLMEQVSRGARAVDDIHSDRVSVRSSVARHKTVLAAGSVSLRDAGRQRDDRGRFVSTKGLPIRPVVQPDLSDVEMAQDDTVLAVTAVRKHHARVPRRQRAARQVPDDSHLPITTSKSEGGRRGALSRARLMDFLGREEESILQRSIYSAEEIDVVGTAGLKTRSPVYSTDPIPLVASTRIGPRELVPEEAGSRVDDFGSSSDSDRSSTQGAGLAREPVVSQARACRTKLSRHELLSVEIREEFGRERLRNERRFASLLKSVESHRAEAAAELDRRWARLEKRMDDLVLPQVQAKAECPGQRSEWEETLKKVSAQQEENLRWARFLRDKEIELGEKERALRTAPNSLRENHEAGPAAPIDGEDRRYRGKVRNAVYVPLPCTTADPHEPAGDARPFTMEYGPEPANLFSQSGVPADTTIGGRRLTPQERTLVLQNPALADLYTDQSAVDGGVAYAAFVSDREICETHISPHDVPGAARVTAVQSKPFDGKTVSWEVWWRGFCLDMRANRWSEPQALSKLLTLLHNGPAQGCVDAWSRRGCSSLKDLLLLLSFQFRTRDEMAAWNKYRLRRTARIIFTASSYRRKHAQQAAERG